MRPAPGGVVAGARYLWRGARLLSAPGLRRYVLAPLAINALLFAALSWWAVTWFGALMAGLAGWLPAWLDWLVWLLWPLFGLALLMVVFFTFLAVANLVGAPFNGLLAEAVERQQGQRPEAASLRQALAQAPRALGNELRKLWYYALRALPLLALFFIPGANLIAPLLWVLFSAWMLAVEYADYPMGNHDLSPAEQRRRLRHCRATALGFGGAVMVGALIPVINFLVMPAAVAGATLMWLEHLRATPPSEQA